MKQISYISYRILILIAFFALIVTFSGALSHYLQYTGNIFLLPELQNYLNKYEIGGWVIYWLGLPGLVFIACFIMLTFLELVIHKRFLSILSLSIVTLTVFTFSAIWAIFNQEPPICGLIGYITGFELSEIISKPLAILVLLIVYSLLIYYNLSFKEIAIQVNNYISFIRERANKRASLFNLKLQHSPLNSTNIQDIDDLDETEEIIEKDLNTTITPPQSKLSLEASNDIKNRLQELLQKKENKKE